MTEKRNILFFLLLWGCCDFSEVHGASNNSQRKSKHHQRVERNDTIQDERILSDMMMPGYRVSSMDRKNATCSANDDNTDRETAMKKTVIDYYYGIESSEYISTDTSIGRSIIRKLEDKLFKQISPAVLWCYYDVDDESLLTRHLLSDNDQNFGSGGDSLSLQVGDFEIDGLRRITLEEARRLSIVSFSTSPEDEQITVDCNFPTSSEHCIVMHGMVTIMHHVTSDVSLIVASVYDSTEKAMDYSEIFMLLKEDDFVDITNIKWLGETEQEAINGGVISSGKGSIKEDFADVTNIKTVVVAGIESKENEKSLPIPYAVSIPLLVLLVFIILIARHQTKRKKRVREQLLALKSFDDDVIVGTGDPPWSFHEGIYHYTRHGAQYLSSSCHECIEAKENGFFTACDLETINEHSSKDFSLDERDQSNRRQRNLITASSKELGTKHSSIDVHNCSSAACKICASRPRNVEFVANSEDSVRLSPFNDLTSIRFGESEV